jgi:hypothetical protein
MCCVWTRDGSRSASATSANDAPRRHRGPIRPGQVTRMLRNACAACSPSAGLWARCPETAKLGLRKCGSSPIFGLRFSEGIPVRESTTLSTIDRTGRSAIFAVRGFVRSKAA